MDRIQAAIAKARANRSALVAPQGPAPAPVAEAAPVAVPIPALVLGPALPPAAAPQGMGPADPAPDPAPVAAPVAALWQALPAVAPAATQMARQHIVTFDVSGGRGNREAVHFDVMRTRLLQQMRANSWRRVAITSPGPGCGKSTVALNLAFSLGRQPDLRVILCELDLRRPSMARILGLRGKHSFARVLEGLAPFAENVVRHGPNLAIATNTGPASRPAELLHSPAVAVALDAIEAAYAPSLMIFDLPPLLATDDALAVLGQMDAALLVAAAETTTIKEIDRSEREIAAQTNVMGVILNKCRYMEKDYGYEYYG